MKTIIITGCSGSIGGYLVEYFSNRKYKIIGIDKIKPKKKNFEFYKIDIKNEKKLNNLYKKIKKKYKHVDILINSAGYIHNELFVSLSKEIVIHNFQNWKKVIENNLNLTFLNSSIYVKNFLGNYSKEKLIINFSSVNSEGVIGQSAYSSAKAAVETLTKVMSMELATFNFRVACVSPGYIKAKSTLQNVNKKKLESIVQSIPLKKLGSLGDIANGLEFIIKSKYFNGKVLKIDGGK